jgi:hypothetical protein
MFDHKPTDGAYFNAMIANRNIGNRNAQIARDNDENARQWMERAQAFEAELAKTKASLENARMSSAGLSAERDVYRDALKVVSPSHVLVSDTGKRFQDGRIKIGGRLVYEKAFDAKGAELRISNPKSHRTD